MKHLVLCVALNVLFFTNTFCSVLMSARFDDENTKTVSFIPRHSFELACNVTSSEKTDVKWEKDGVPVNDIKALNGRFRYGKEGSSIYTLYIHHTVEDDSGNYSCVAYQKGESVESRIILVTSKIAVKVLSNINVVEGEKLRIQCNVVGKPFPKLHWHYQNDSFSENYYESEDRVILEEDPERPIPNAILRIEEVQMYDRGTFKCIGESELGDDEVSSECFIRVKDKYAALWPFIGICAEVFVLCAIIFIYEKKRNKTELEESDTDQSPDQKNTPDDGKDTNLRHRQ